MATQTENNSSFFTQLLNNLSQCELCLSPTRQSLFLCPECYQQLPVPLSCCIQCAEPLTIDTEQRLRCGQCQRQPPHFDYTQAQFEYRPPINLWVTAMKDRRQFIWAHKLVRLMERQPPETLTQVDALVAIPSPSRRLWWRGFNPAGVIASLLSQRLDIPLLEGALIKRRGLDQRGLNRRQRRHNLTTSLIAGKLDLSGQHLLLIDDVMTTGATLDVAAALLKQQGAVMVGTWVLAKTPPRPDNAG